MRQPSTSRYYEQPRVAPWPTQSERRTMRINSWYRSILKLSTVVLVLSVSSTGQHVPATYAQPAAKKPNILVIFGDDIGISNVSAYSHGLMGYRTPNIDRIARE